MSFLSLRACFSLVVWWHICVLISVQAKVYVFVLGGAIIMILSSNKGRLTFLMYIHTTGITNKKVCGVMHNILLEEHTWYALVYTTCHDVRSVGENGKYASLNAWTVEKGYYRVELSRHSWFFGRQRDTHPPLWTPVPASPSRRRIAFERVPLSCSLALAQ